MERPAPTAPGEPLRRPAGRPVLEFDDVSYSYGRTPVLRDISLTVREQELLAIVGANGAGKTTLMRLGLGLLSPTQGTVRLFGTPIERFRDWGHIGYVPQRAAASSVLPISVEEVVRTGLAGQLGLVGRPTARHHERMAHVLDLLGLTGVARLRITSLSGGQQQRALIARALVTEPRLLVLDEPTTGVDAQAREVLRSSIEHLVELEGVAVVYVSHDPEAFFGMADRIIEIRAGRIIETGPHDHPHLEAEHPSEPAPAVTPPAPLAQPPSGRSS